MLAQRESIVVQDTKELRALVMHEMATHGNACDLNHMDVRGVRSMENVFRDLPFVGDISRWNVLSMQSAERMFMNCPFNGDISGWNTSRLLSAVAMFKGSLFNGDISAWDTAYLQDANAMFRESAFNGDLSRWNVERLMDAHNMFVGSAYAQDLSAWSMRAKCRIQWMVDDAFKGVLPRLSPIKHPLLAYCDMVKGDLDNYLANNAFSHVHASLVLYCDASTSDIRPRWASEEVYQQICTIKHLAQAFQLSMEETHARLMQSMSGARAQSLPIADLLEP